MADSNIARTIGISAGLILVYGISSRRNRDDGFIESASITTMVFGLIMAAINIHSPNWVLQFWEALLYALTFISLYFGLQQVYVAHCWDKAIGSCLTLQPGERVVVSTCRRLPLNSWIQAGNTLAPIQKRKGTRGIHRSVNTPNQFSIAILRHLPNLSPGSYAELCVPILEYLRVTSEE